MRWLALLPLAFAVSCAASSGPTPLVRVASSAEAQIAFSDLQRSWASKERLDLRDLEQRFRQFAILHSRDPLVPVVHAYLAILLAEQSRTGEAASLVQLYSQEPDGPTRDLFDVVKAYVMRKGGRANDALALLQPIAGKIIDAAARALLLEELSMAALEAHADYEAIGYFDAWLVGTTGVDHERARERIEELLAKLSPVVLESAYQAMRSTNKPGVNAGKKGAGYSKEIRTLVAERLSTIAVDEGDTVLARWLLDPTAGATPTSLQLQPGLGELAASRRGIRAIEGRSVGLLLPSANLGRLTEAADVLRGLSFSLGLPDPKATTRLVVREGGEQVRQMQQALEELAGEGVSVVVAGFDPETAGRALAWGDASNIAVIALVPPLITRTLRHGFQIGEDVHPQLRTLDEAWKRTMPASRRRVVFLSGTRAPDLELTSATDPPVDRAIPCDDELDAPLRETKPSAYWVSGASGCTNGLLRQLVRIGKERSGLGDIALGTTLESFVAQSPSGITLSQLTIAAGILPSVPATADATLVAEVRTYTTRYGLTPNYWASLGHDAGVIAQRAMKPLPDDRTTSDEAVYLRRALVEAGIMAAQAPLWSTDARGFASQRLLPRTLSAVAVGKP